MYRSISQIWLSLHLKIFILDNTCIIFRFSHIQYLQFSPIMDPVSYFSYQPVLNNWCNKGCGMYYPIGGMVHIKCPLLLTKSVAYVVAAAGFLSLFEWYFVRCHTTVNNVLSASLYNFLPCCFPQVFYVKIESVFW